MLLHAFKRLGSAVVAYWSSPFSPVDPVTKPRSDLVTSASFVRLARLPLELVAMILNELAVLDELDGGTARAPMMAPSREIRMALSRCARVSRSWYLLAREHLYRSIVVVNLCHCEAFVSAIERNPDLALLSRNLVLFGGTLLASPSASEARFERRYDLLVRVLRLCPRLERVRLMHNWDIFCPLVIDALTNLNNLSSLYCRPFVLKIVEQYSSILDAHDLLSRLPPSLSYLFVDGTVGSYDFLHHVPSTIGLVEYRLSNTHQRCDPTFVFQELEADLVEGVKAIPGSHINILHKADVDSALVGRVVAGFAAQGVELAAIRTA
ncbi:uncharacterized protein RHOBADRAFT_46869 [Rhodotorula graminis WP1]|uniref:F-box domain-containing protein n=1 Tax=Rhodotorula graminis (strain WP1) TaxID=578459 RepID=A0A0P9EL34_RHOGW|nr:uncharacterized protein RHOBADRAFT_46869 [Rhodotorula graminis WP1]KPV72418.1 hypothetical protein RHOBADRAFT_46869 [Rhodotorula graminis WP1]